jgi:hypothetical protein
MKKLLSLILCFLMIVPCFVFGAFAEEETEEELSNLALSAGIKATSYWNASTLPKSAVNGESTGDIPKPGEWKGHNNFWNPCQPGRDNGTGPYKRLEEGVESFQFTFKGLNRGYKLISYVDIYTRQTCSNNPLYTVKCLINGVWTEVASMKQQQGEVLSGYGVEAYKLHLVLPEEVIVDGAVCKVNTKSLKIEIREFAEAGGCGHGWDVPCIYEFEVYGKTGFVPEIDLHDGALLTTNAAIGGQISASSSATGRYPALAGDTLVSTSWVSKNTTDNEWIMSEFDKPYDLESLKLNIGMADAANSYSIDAEVKIGGVWSTVETKTVASSTGEIADVAFDITGKNLGVEAIRFTFSSQGGKAACMSEMIATIADGKKCEYLYEFMTTNRKQSTANGNLAIYGEPYATSVFDHLGISDISYINDGAIADADYAWFAKSFEKGQYCGVTLKESKTVNKVTLYFNDAIIGGYNAREYYVIGFDVQVKLADGTFKTVASGTNLDASKANAKNLDKYIVSIDIPAIETDDVRVSFTNTDVGFAFLKELEIYGPEVYGGYSTYAHGRKTVAKTSAFGEAFVLGRASFMNQISPVHTLLVSVNDFKASLWI